MARTTSSDVQALLGADYDTAAARSLTAFITTANLVTTRVNACATAKGLTLSAEELEVLERWLAAHYYHLSEGGSVQREKLGKAEAEYARKGDRLLATVYGQAALDADWSGCLAALSSGKRVGFGWLGKRPSEQVDYEDRD